jgi:hypothetical protein
MLHFYIVSNVILEHFDVRGVALNVAILGEINIAL